MPRRSGGTHKGVEEKRRSLPIYQHYTLSPGKTKSHHPEAKCNHCLKEFVCGSKQRLIRHLRKCNSISNPEQIIAETLNTLARNSATGQLNHSILEASNLLPSQISHQAHLTQQQQQQQQQQQHQHQHQNHQATANSNSNNNTSGSSSNDAGGNGAQPPAMSDAITPIKRPVRRGRRPGSTNIVSKSPGITVTTGLDGKTHFTPASQLPPAMPGAPLIAQVMESPRPLKLNSDPIDKAYLKLVLTRNLPLSLCDTKEFQVWVKTFTNDYKPPSSANLVAQNLKNEAQAAKQRISNILVKAPKKIINLELHSWHDDSRGHKWYAIIANLEHKRFLISVKDVYVQPHQTLDGSDKLLAEFIDESIRRVGSDRINSLVLSGDDAYASHALQSLYSTHPSIVINNCWRRFTNSLCSDTSEHNNNALNTSIQQATPTLASSLANNLSLSDYMHWFLTYGKGLFDSWSKAPDTHKHQSIARYLSKFSASLSNFKLLFAAYLLNPKHRCAYVTQKTKNVAIEEILNIASEFMPEESDGHTIFDQWKLYLAREEPYDMVYEEGRSSPLDWWMSLPCAESIRRVALRILRLKAFTTPKRETMFSQLYFYEDETNTSLTSATFEDVAVLRYFYDFEDKAQHNSLHNHSTSNNASSHSHNNHSHQPSYSATVTPETNGQLGDSMSDGRQSFSDSFSNVIVEPYLNDNGHHHHHMDTQSSTPNMTIENLPGYDLFLQYIDYNETGVQIVEEPIEKKKRKWTAQEILSKCQSNHSSNNNNNNNDDMGSK